MDADARLAEIRDRHQAATKGTWGTYYDGAIYHLAADQRVDGSCSRQIGEIPDGEDKTQAFHDAMFIGRAPDDIRFLLARVADLEATLERYVGKEPTVADEIAYLNRCLNAVHDLCREADEDGNTADGKFTPAAVQQAASGEREERSEDNRRRIYIDGHGNAWIEVSKDYVTSIETSLWDGEPIGNVRERTGEIHEIGRTW